MKKRAEKGALFNAHIYYNIFSPTSQPRPRKKVTQNVKIFNCPRLPRRLCVPPRPPSAAGGAEKTLFFALRSEKSQDFHCDFIVKWRAVWYTIREKIRITLFAASFARFAVYRLCNAWVLLHPLRGNSSQNLAAKSAEQSKAARRALRRGEVRSACRVARARASTMHERLGFRFGSGSYYSLIVQ